MSFDAPASTWTTSDRWVTGSCSRPRLREAVTAERGLPRMRLLRLLPSEHLRMVREGAAVVERISELVDRLDADNL